MSVFCSHHSDQNRFHVETLSAIVTATYKKGKKKFLWMTLAEHAENAGERFKIQKARCQMSAQPLAAEAASLIEQETPAAWSFIHEIRGQKKHLDSGSGSGMTGNTSHTGAEDNENVQDFEYLKVFMWRHIPRDWRQVED